jgi:recombination protein RecA
MATDREATIAALFQDINKKFGKDTVVNAGEFKFTDIPRITTGIFGLDWALGGGIPVGRVTKFFGHKSSTKTTSLLRTLGRAQKLCSNCWKPFTVEEGKNGPKKVCPCGKFRDVKIFWADVEGAWDESWSKRFLDVSSLIFTQPEYAEETIDITDAMLRSGEVDIVVIDSLAFMTPKNEIENVTEKLSMGEQAKIIGKAMRKFVSTLNEVGRDTGRRPTVLLTNQLRQKVGLVFGSPDIEPGGLAAGFATSVEVRFSPGKASVDEESGKTISQEFKWKVEKNKVGPAKMEGEFNQSAMNTELRKIGQIMDEEYVVRLADSLGVLKLGKGTCTYHGEKLDLTISELCKSFVINQEGFEVLKEECMVELMKQYA